MQNLDGQISLKKNCDSTQICKMTGVTDRRFIFTRGPAALGYPTQESPLFERNASGIHGSFVGNPAFGYRHLGRPPIV